MPTVVRFCVGFPIGFDLLYSRKLFVFKSYVRLCLFQSYICLIRRIVSHDIGELAFSFAQFQHLLLTHCLLKLIVRIPVWQVTTAVLFDIHFQHVVDVSLRGILRHIDRRLGGSIKVIKDQVVCTGVGFAFI